MDIPVETELDYSSDGFVSINEKQNQNSNPERQSLPEDDYLKENLKTNTSISNISNLNDSSLGQSQNHSANNQHTVSTECAEIKETDSLSIHKSIENNFFNENSSPFLLSGSTDGNISEVQQPVSIIL